MAYNGKKRYSSFSNTDKYFMGNHLCSSIFKLLDDRDGNSYVNCHSQYSYTVIDFHPWKTQETPTFPIYPIEVLRSFHSYIYCSNMRWSFSLAVCWYLLHGANFTISAIPTNQSNIHNFGECAICLLHSYGDYYVSHRLFTCPHLEKLPKTGFN